MEVIRDNEYYKYYIKERIGKQTIYLELQGDVKEQKDNTVYFNVYLSIYNKRKHATQNETEAKITGADPFKNAATAIRMFDMLEEYVIEDCLADGLDLVIYAHWVDNRRRDAYTRVLKKRGYTMGYLDNTLIKNKVLYKKINATS